jgi:copper(I)-binding protein
MSTLSHFWGPTVIAALIGASTPALAHHTTDIDISRSATTTGQARFVSSKHQMSNHAPIAVEAPFARASAGQARNGAAYLSIKNTGAHADRLIGAKAAVSKRAELHTHLHENGVMKMRPVDAIEVPANGMAMLKPGGDHVMLMGLTAPLVEGQTFPLTLVFEKAGEIEVMVSVGGVGAMGGGHGSGQGSSHGGHKN